MKADERRDNAISLHGYNLKEVISRLVTVSLKGNRDGLSRTIEEEVDETSDLKKHRYSDLVDRSE